MNIILVIINNIYSSPSVHLSQLCFGCHNRYSVDYWYNDNFSDRQEVPKDKTVAELLTIESLVSNIGCDTG